MPISTFSPVSFSLIQRSRYATIPPVGVDKKHEQEVAKQKLESRPEEVTTSSSVRLAFEENRSQPVNQDDEDITGSLKRDVNTIKDTLALKTVPPLSYALGIAGTVPYLATSIATVYLGWDLNTEFPAQSTFLSSIMVSHETADYWLKLLEPIQLGYGAVIISFLGAIHWGLEYAEKTPLLERTRFRYGLGVLAPMVAWPTLLMPVQFALTAQFGAFIGLYLADTRATYRGWAPPWYATYRFVLTFIVGSAILISLVGREKIGADRPQLENLRERFHKDKGSESEKYVNWAKLEQEEKDRIKKEKEEEEKKRKEEEKKRKQEEKKRKDTEKNKGGEGANKKDDKKGDGEKKGDDKGDDDKKSNDKEGDRQESNDKKDSGGKKEGEEKNDDKDGEGEEKK
ncbi:hypothetical protein NKR23_g4218 [Pleurostoma richardsiae]|uniref:Mitochondrial inner membrane protein 1 n=1 Tax=Pleurostoma richardsiae TaxID=41990 RepID=A0AA38RJW8_9PEZI|nr:hypothetical protein NKR23_g4218 [Pleurostoma richardsiae]